MADNCIDVYYKLDRYYLTGNSIDFALNYKDLGGDVTEMTILGNDVFADALEERLKEREIPLRILKRTDRPTAAAKMDLVDGDKKHLHFEGNSGLICGIPLIKIYAIKNNNTANVMIAESITRSIKINDPGVLL